MATHSAHAIVTGGDCILTSSPSAYSLVQVDDLVDEHLDIKDPIGHCTYYVTHDARIVAASMAVAANALVYIPELPCTTTLTTTLGPLTGRTCELVTTEKNWAAGLQQRPVADVDVDVDDLAYTLELPCTAA
eukprot:5216241-Amphidinium_carterae.1